MNLRTVPVVLVAAAAVVCVWAGFGLGEQNRGAENLTLYGGKTGDVLFPHHQHQNVLKDCNLCHSVFAQKAGIIQEMKSQNQLQKKQVMNTQCTACHKQKQNAGEKAGPTTCRQCHTKK